MARYVCFVERDATSTASPEDCYICFAATAMHLVTLALSRRAYFDIMRASLQVRHHEYIASPVDRNVGMFGRILAKTFVTNGSSMC